MFDAEPICPYTGLRSFTEEESLYFKGREEDIDLATAQLQRNKFLMLTGASGDGKSSLIYAGIIPNARAGFLKAKYTQWCVADFRPERTPFENLCKALGKQLGIENTDIVRSELNHGFSAIIDLYRNSKRHLDTHSVAWERADDAGKAALKREAANLMILVDQFEEFFTNPENYHRGVPSHDATLVLNLLLETSRIALEEDLPIYIVFTMRSDFIGQCAAFRGLPEYIGFSQFFVPRLNRTQLQQVIEEPAVLSGNRITRRLTERLIHDLTEGVDQLPILQHALNQVWHAANEGREELDLVHYAMVGGMPVQELPDEQVERFRNWFAGLPEPIKACYHEPNLQNVLDTHTNKLYEQAAAYYAEKTGRSIADQDAKAIIKAAFTCLTKIDQGRAVRNRMTLEEIREITGRNEFSTEDVGAVLDIFREPGNTFIRPFMTEDPASRVLQPGDVLDITHESLIRNWAYLEQWAKEEFDNYTVSLDFEQQLNRWVESGKSKGFLLPIGPLTYFESWYNKAKPNAYWIARYLPEDIAGDQKLETAKAVLGNAQEFIRRSAKKHVITRTVMRYGAKRIAAVLAGLGVLVFAFITIRNYFNRQNSQVLKEIRQETFALTNLPKLKPYYYAQVVVEQFILGNLTLPELMKHVKEPAQQVRIATGLAIQLVTYGRNEPRDLIRQCLQAADSVLEKLPLDGTRSEVAERLKLGHDFGIITGFACYFNTDPLLQELARRNARRSARRALYIFKNQPADYSDARLLTLALENGINYKAFTTEELDQLLQILSPFENPARTAWVKKQFDYSKLMVRGTYSYGSKFNGLYQELAYLYAAKGDAGKALQCTDTLLKYSEGYGQNDYGAHIDNATNTAAVFYTYGISDALDPFVNGYCGRKKISPVEFYNRMLSRTLLGNFELADQLIYADFNQNYLNNNLCFAGDSLLSFFYQRLKTAAGTISDPGERAFNLAVIQKNEGESWAYRSEIRGAEDTLSAPLFAKAIQQYRQVPVSFLNKSANFVGSVATSRSITQPQKFLFLYPDFRVPFEMFEVRASSNFYQSAAFTRYILERNLLDTLYREPDELRYFEWWLRDYQFCMSNRGPLFHDRMRPEILEKLAEKLETSDKGQVADRSILYFHLSDHAFGQNKPAQGVAYLEKIQPGKLIDVLNRSPLTFEMTGKAIGRLVLQNRFDLAYRFIDVFKKEGNRSSLYGYASRQANAGNRSPEWARRLLDSAKAEMNRGNPEVFQPARHQVAIALMEMDPGKNSREAYRTIKNSFVKYIAMAQFSTAYGQKGNLYMARKQAPPNIALDDRAVFLYYTLLGYNSTRETGSVWVKYRDNFEWFRSAFMIYFDENE